MYSTFAEILVVDGAHFSEVQQSWNKVYSLITNHVPFFPPISEQDREILRILLHDISLAEVARRLRLERTYMNTQVKRIYRLFGVTTREELMVCLWQAYRKNKDWLYKPNSIGKLAMPLLLFTGFLAMHPLPSAAADKEQDLPFMHRYPDSRISTYQHVRFDEVRMPLGPFTDQGEPSKSESLQGEVVYIDYFNPHDRSPLEIMSNYQQTLQQQGFQVLWQCANNACNTSHNIGKVFDSNPIWRPATAFSTFFGNGGGRMSTLRLRSPNGSQTWVYLWVSGSSPQGGGETYVYSVQTKPMQTGMVTADRELYSASDMDQALAQQGRFSMHIPFDYNKASLRSDAQTQIQGLAQVLRTHPNWMIGLDGHTDAVGSASFNQKLSEERAHSVKVALMALGIPARQIATRGLGATQPIADDKTSDGRAKNRRVEVVNLTPGFIPGQQWGIGGMRTPTTSSAAPNGGPRMVAAESSGGNAQSGQAPGAATQPNAYEVYRDVTNTVRSFLP
ncbi:MAG: OmpA family protein [Candidatus Igneacidithiobacillus chanchocoensis]